MTSPDDRELVPVQRLIALRCAACGQEVRVKLAQRFAKCECGNEWEWKHKPLRVTL